MKIGTNYYAVKKKPRIVEVYDELHLGKSSAGWKFLFNECEQFHNFDEFKEFILNNKEYVIKDEYDRIIQAQELLDLIERKQNDEICKNNSENFKYSKNIEGYRFSDRDFS